jgi:hypothetical protein
VDLGGGHRRALGVLVRLLAPPAGQAGEHLTRRGPDADGAIYCDGGAEDQFLEGVDLELSHWTINHSEEVPVNPKKDTQKSAKSTRAINKKFKGFTDEERVAMTERVQELKAAARRGPRADKADAESAVLAKITEMPEPDRAMARRLHAIIKASAPALSPRLWYGMPAYAKDGNVVCFFQSAQKFKTRYATVGFSDTANLDEGALWPVAFALKELTATEEATINALVKKAVG